MFSVLFGPIGLSRSLPDTLARSSQAQKQSTLRHIPRNTRSRYCYTITGRRLISTYDCLTLRHNSLELLFYVINNSLKNGMKTDCCLSQHVLGLNGNSAYKKEDFFETRSEGNKVYLRKSVTFNKFR